MKLADEKTVRNEFFEAEIDPQTGGLRAFAITRRASIGWANCSLGTPAALRMS